MASKMTNAKWGVLIGAGFCLDATEWALDGAVVGVVINPALDAIVSIALPWYLNTQGVKLNSKKLITWITAGAFETFLAGAIPLWGLDMVITMLLDKADSAIDTAVPKPVQDVALNKANKGMANTGENKVAGHIGPASDTNKLDKAA